MFRYCSNTVPISVLIFWPMFHPWTDDILMFLLMFQWCSGDVPGCSGGVPVLLLYWHSSDAPVTFWWCFRDVPGVFQWYSGHIPVMFRWCFSDVPVFQSSFNVYVEVPVLWRWYYSGVPVMLRHVPGMFQGCSGVFQWCSGDAPMMIWEFTGGVTVLFL